MAKPDLSKMDLDELKALQKDVEKAIKTYEERTRKEARAAAEAAAAKMGYSLDELLGTKGKTRKQVNPPKYQHPENPTLTWSGRGRKPVWFKEAIDAGVPEEKMKIA